MEVLSQKYAAPKDEQHQLQGRGGRDTKYPSTLSLDLEEGVKLSES